MSKLGKRHRTFAVPADKNCSDNFVSLLFYVPYTVHHITVIWR